MEPQGRFMRFYTESQLLLLHQNRQEEEEAKAAQQKQAGQQGVHRMALCL